MNKVLNKKGAATYNSSCPGGPSSGSFSEWVGWAVGRVKDIYIQYEQGGDMFVGRSLCGLPLLLLSQFSSSRSLMFLKSETYGSGVTLH